MAFATILGKHAKGHIRKSSVSDEMTVSVDLCSKFLGFILVHINLGMRFITRVPSYESALNNLTSQSIINIF